MTVGLPPDRQPADERGGHRSHPGRSGHAAPGAHGTRSAVPRTVLLIESDPSDSATFEELVTSTDQNISVLHSSTLDEGVRAGRLHRPDCVVIDLRLPDVDGLDALVAVRDALPDVPVVVMTDWSREELGGQAVGAGAQDYLVKGEEQADDITRSIHFAIERKRAEVAAGALAVAAARQREQQRLERHLLAKPVLRSPDVRLAGRYVVSRDGLIGGDFSDCVELEDGTIRFIVGDVSGHGTDEAALGVALRIAWRTLAMTSAPDADVLTRLELVLEAERAEPDVFATVCEVTIDPGRRSLVVRSAGHPPPILSDGRVVWDDHRRAPLGVDIGQRECPGTTIAISAPVEVTLYTDGLYEIRGRHGAILALDDVVPVILRHPGPGSTPLAGLLREIEEMAMTGWRDDVALARLAIGTSAGGEAHHAPA
jgi:DNA-binding NarL/FixJ family response regulator